MRRILIIGSQGYLGSALTDYLQTLNYDCVGADIGFFQHGVLYTPKTVPFIDKDARNIDKNDLKGFDVVLMLAGISNDPFGNLSYEKIYDPTREYAINIAKMCKKLGIRYIFPSSCSVYGTNEGTTNETDSTKPLTPYSLNKLQIEQDLAKLADKSFSPIALRLGTVFGVSPRIRFDLVINMLCGMAMTEKKVVLNSDGLAWRPHIYIKDVCQAFKYAIDWDYNGGELMVLNVGHNDNNARIIDIAKLVQKQVSGCQLEFLEKSVRNGTNNLIKDRKIQDGVDKRTYSVSFDKIHKLMPNFKAKWRVEKGIKELLKNIRYWQLDSTKFKQRDFYRLQQIEYLYQTKQIDDNLFWAKDN